MYEYIFLFIIRGVPKFHLDDNNRDKQAKIGLQSAFPGLCLWNNVSNSFDAAHMHNVFLNSFVGIWIVSR